MTCAACATFSPRWKDSIAYSLVLDGAGSDTIVAEALGSRRFEVIVRSRFLLERLRLAESYSCPGPHGAPKHHLPHVLQNNFQYGIITWTSVNSIPESTTVRMDIRSTSMAEN